MDFCVQADHRLKIKENKKIDKYLDLVSELEKLWKMKVTLMQIVIDTITKGLEKDKKN